MNKKKYTIIKMFKRLAGFLEILFFFLCHEQVVRIILLATYVDWQYVMSEL